MHITLLSFVHNVTVGLDALSMLTANLSNESPLPAKHAMSQLCHNNVIFGHIYSWLRETSKYAAACCCWLLLTLSDVAAFSRKLK